MFEEIPGLELTSSQRQAVAAAVRLGETCHTDLNHVQQVTHLALTLFDGLAPARTGTPVEKYWLLMAGLLHDAGWIEGAKGHHKASLQIILNTPILPLDNRERLVIGSIARYHRKVLPDLKHDHYRALSEEERSQVDYLASILRVADGLDHRHLGVVEELRVDLSPSLVRITFLSDRPAQIEIKNALEKGDLLKKVLERDLDIQEALPDD